MVVETPGTAVSTRTRRAILDAAVSVWAREPGASLGAIAAAAAVSRTTLHRYFLQRDDLAAAVGLDVVTRLDAAARRARLSEGLAVEALQRLCQEYFELADVLAVMFNGSQLVDDDTWAEAGCVASDLADVVDRGRRDGSVDGELTAVWVESLLWALLYAAWTLLRDGRSSKADAMGMLARSFTRAVSRAP